MNAPLFAQLRYAGPADTLWRLTGSEVLDMSGPLAVGAEYRLKLATRDAPNRRRHQPPRPRPRPERASWSTSSFSSVGPRDTTTDTRHDFVSENDRDDDQQPGRDRRETFHPFSSSADMRRKIACAIRGENSFKRMNSDAANGRMRR